MTNTENVTEHPYYCSQCGEVSYDCYTYGHDLDDEPNWDEE